MRQLNQIRPVVVVAVALLAVATLLSVIRPSGPTEGPAFITIGESSSQPTYAVTFAESGLPVGTNWSVTIQGLTLNSTTGSIVFGEPNGSYLFSVSQVWGYTVNPEGNVTVTGAGVTVPVAFVPVAFGVVFVESGLPNGTSWSVTVSGLTINSSGSSVAFSEMNGTYGYTVGAVSGYTATPGFGTVTVAGAGVSTRLAFTKSDPSSATETATFTESELPSGTTWWVNVTSGPDTSSSTTTLSFAVAPGHYVYTVASDNKDYAAKGGSFVVKTKPVSEKVKFRLEIFRVTVTESGLAAKTKWCFDLTGGKSYCTKAGGSIRFRESNGTYAYVLTTTAAGYTGPAGFLVVEGPTTWSVTYSH